mmetsp:Transcript_4465/g.8244  ORF Transcript_4465/g.8244 Transcript_4465/m.8244 type:complete len:201 (+) Transcript_4465:1551-2153(+)
MIQYGMLMVRNALLGERLTLRLMVRIRSTSQRRRGRRRFRVGRSSVPPGSGGVATSGVGVVVDGAGSRGVGENGSEFFEVATPIPGFFHLIDGHLEGLACQAFVVHGGGGGRGVRRRSMVIVGGSGEEGAVEMMAEEEEALEACLGGRLVTRNVGFEVEGWGCRWRFGGFCHDCWYGSLVCCCGRKGAASKKTTFLALGG